MSNYNPKLKQILREAGCYFERPGKGDHEIWFSPVTQMQLSGLLLNSVTKFNDNRLRVDTL